MASPLALAPMAAGDLHLHVTSRLVLIIVALIVLWLLTLLLKPFGRCFMCRGKGMRVRKGKGKARKCWLCKGKGRRQRTGSRTVHRIRRSAVAGWHARRDGA
jgi:hypothetical protein